MLESPMLQGMEDLIGVIKNPGRAEYFLSNLLGSFIPTGLSDFAGIYDPYRRMLDLTGSAKAYGRVWQHVFLD